MSLKPVGKAATMIRVAMRLSGYIRPINIKIKAIRKSVVMRDHLVTNFIPDLRVHNFLALLHLLEFY
jgi:hypothetical protein